MNSIVQSIINQSDIGIIPENTRCYLWDPITQTKSQSHFVTTTELRVLMKKEYGPMSKLISDLMYPSKRNSLDVADLKDMASQIPLFGRFFDKTDATASIMTALGNHFGQDADVILMAGSDDGIMAVQFLYAGNVVNYRDLVPREDQYYEEEY
jgi:hypothetical protein